MNKKRTNKIVYTLKVNIRLYGDKDSGLAKGQWHCGWLQSEAQVMHQVKPTLGFHICLFPLFEVQLHHCIQHAYR